MNTPQSMFPINEWNVHDLTLTKNGLTNNQTKGQIYRFASFVSYHQTVDILIEKVRLKIATTHQTKLVKTDIENFL